MSTEIQILEILKLRPNENFVITEVLQKLGREISSFNASIIINHARNIHGVQVTESKDDILTTNLRYRVN